MLTLEMCRVPSLAFAVGVYLPLSSSSPIFFGGLISLLSAIGTSDESIGHDP